MVVVRAQDNFLAEKTQRANERHMTYGRQIQRLIDFPCDY